MNTRRPVQALMHNDGTRLTIHQGHVTYTFGKKEAESSQPTDLLYRLESTGGCLATVFDGADLWVAKLDMASIRINEETGHAVVDLLLFNLSGEETNEH